MKTQRFWAGLLAVLGLSLLVFFACRPDDDTSDGSGDNSEEPGKPVPDTLSETITFTILLQGSYPGTTSRYYWVARDRGTYDEITRRIGKTPPDMDFTEHQVVAVFDTLRNHPAYRLGIRQIEDKGDYLNVQVERVYRPEEGGSDQAYIVVRMPRSEKPVEFENLPFEPDTWDVPYTPRMGVSDCLSHDTKSSTTEYFYFLFAEDGHLLIEHQNMELNCGDLIVETSVVQNGMTLSIMEEERLGPDSMLTVCECLKNVGYRSDNPISGTGDSLQIDYRFKTFGRGGGAPVRSGFPHKETAESGCRSGRSQSGKFGKKSPSSDLHSVWRGCFCLSPGDDLSHYG